MPEHAPIRSFVHRHGKLTKGQRNAIDEYWSVYGVEAGDHAIDFEQLFSRSAPLVVEIGFGNGKSLLEMAAAEPEKNFLGIEVHAPGLGSLLVQLKHQPLDNVRVSRCDAVEVLEHQIGDNTVDRMQIYFPDPWHKKRHHKRRLIKAEFAKLVRRKLRDGGELHLATDWQNYAEQMLQVLGEEPGLEKKFADFAERPAIRPLTKYEQRGTNLGHEVWDLVFSKIPPC